MATGLIEVAGSDVLCSIAGGGTGARFPLSRATPKLQAWAERYDSASRRDDEAELAAIGGEMFAWLDDDGGWAAACANALCDDRILEIRVGGVGGANEIAPLDSA